MRSLPWARACYAPLPAALQRSHYHAPRGTDDLPVLRCFEEVLADFSTYGCRRLTAELARRGHALNHKRVQRLLQQHDLARHAQRRVATRDSRRPYGRFANLLRGLAEVRPDQVWCADITDMRLLSQSVCLATVLDVYTRATRGWALGASLASDLACAALRRALARVVPDTRHSDLGIQYAATDYAAVRYEHGIQPSTAARGRPTDNPYSKRVIRTIKEEDVALNECRSLGEAREQIGRFIDDVYHHKRTHSVLGYLTPAEFDRQWHESLVQVPSSPLLGG